LTVRENCRPGLNRQRQRARRGEPAWHQWSLEAILQRFADCCQRLSAELAACRIRGITVTTFGVDGALVDEHGALLYPTISWKCPRTLAVMENIGRLIAPQRLQEIAGVGAFSFNTLYKLVWLKENITRSCWQRRTPGCLSPR
jgi:L-fuculokinase